MLVARNEESHRALARMVKEREVEREYTALVEGQLGSRTGTIDAPLGRHRRQRTKRAVKGAGSREARTHFEVIETLPGDTLVHARLETGPHAPDPRPLRRDRASGGRGPRIRHREAATAWSASSCTRRGSAFTHPRTGERLEFTSELPDDLRCGAAIGAKNRLRKVSTRARLGRDCSAQRLQSRGLCTQPPPRGTGRCPGTPGFPQPRRGITGAPDTTSSDRKVRWPR